MNNLRQFVQRFGLDIHKYRPIPDRLAWLKNLGIKTVIDVGANVGQFAKEIRVYLPNAFIYSFEPLPDCFTELQKLGTVDKRFKAFNCALGEKAGSAIINRSAYSLSSSLLPMAASHKTAFPHTKDSVPETIEVKTMDEFFTTKDLDREILIKIDTQGYEDKVIAGGLKTFAQAKVLIVETSFIELYETQPLFETIYTTLTQMGFTYQGALHQKLNPKTGQVIFEDSIFIKQ